MAKSEAFFTLGKPIAKLYTKKFNFEYDELSDIEGPYLLLSNHTTDYDPIFIGIAVGQPIRFVASEHMAHKGFASKLIISLAKPILHQKGRVGLATTKAMIKAAREGDNICLFPEGGRTFTGETGTILPSTAKLAKSLKIKLVCVRIIGGYEVQPRWCVKQNKGRIQLRLASVYSPEELKAMSEEDLMEKIKKDLYVKAGVPKDLTGIESTLFMASPEEIAPDMDIPALDKKQKDFVFAGKGDFSDDAELYEVGEDHQPHLLARGLLKANRKGFSFDGKPFSINSAALVSRNTFVFFDENKHFEIRGGQKFSALKYYYQYQFLNSEVSK